MDDRTPLGLRRLTVLELDASSIAIRLWGLNGDSAYIHKVHTGLTRVIDTNNICSY
jgi:hypothetical protein